MALIKLQKGYKKLRSFNMMCRPRTKEQYVVDNFDWDVYYSLEDFACTAETCDDPENCDDALVRYKMYPGQRIVRSPENHLGRGGAGRVYRAMWHGQPAAFKFTRMDSLQYLGQIITY